MSDEQELPEGREDFKQGAVQLVTQTGKPIAQVARELGVNEGTLGNWCAKRRAGANGQAELSESERAELVRLRKELIELRMQRDWADSLISDSGI